MLVIVNLNPASELRKFSEKLNGKRRRGGLKHMRFKGDLHRLQSYSTEKGIDFFFLSFIIR